MEYDCHIFLKYLVFQMKNLVFEIKNLVFWSEGPLDFDRKTWYFKSKFEILSFSHIEVEILSISSNIPSISKKALNLGF